jgi:hypothetical protein
MNSDPEHLFERVILAFVDLWMSLGAMAWLILGVLLIAGLLASMLVLRWIRRGGLSRRAVLGFYGHGQGSWKS